MIFGEAIVRVVQLLCLMDIQDVISVRNEKTYSQDYIATR